MVGFIVCGALPADARCENRARIWEVVKVRCQPTGSPQPPSGFQLRWKIPPALRSVVPSAKRRHMCREYRLNARKFHRSRREKPSSIQAGTASGSAWGTCPVKRHGTEQSFANDHSFNQILGPTIVMAQATARRHHGQMCQRPSRTRATVPALQRANRASSTILETTR